MDNTETHSIMFSLSQLHYAQDTINNRFRHGRTLDDSLRDLLRHRRPEDELPPMDVMLHRGRYYVVEGNRRLYLLKQLASAGLVDRVPVNVKTFHNRNFKKKFTTDCGGVSIRILHDASMEYKIMNIINEYKMRKASAGDDVADGERYAVTESEEHEHKLPDNTEQLLLKILSSLEEVFEQLSIKQNRRSSRKT